MPARKRRPPPSKARYDRKVPVLSLRVSADLKARLDRVRATTGKSLADIVREAVGAQEASSEAAYRKGFRDGKARFGVSYPCGRCGGRLLAEGQDARRAAGDCLESEGWGHASCPT